MTEMTLKESLERYSEGLKQASSRARELGRLQNNPLWESIADSLTQHRIKGEGYARAYSLSKGTISKQLDNLCAQLGKPEGGVN